MKAITQLTKRQDGTMAYRPGGQSVVHTAPPTHPANATLARAAQIVADRRRQAEIEAAKKQLAEDQEKLAALEVKAAEELKAKMATAAMDQSTGPENEPFWKRWFNKLKAAVGFGAATEVVSAMPAANPRSAPSSLADRLENAADARPKAAKGELSTALDRARPAKPGTGGAARNPDDPSMLPESSEAPAQVQKDEQSVVAADKAEPVIAERIEETANGFRIVYPDGLSVEVSNSDPDAAVLREALDQSIILDGQYQALRSELEKTVAKPAPDLVVGKIERMPDSPGGVPRFIHVQENGTWHALNLSAQEMSTLVAMNDACKVITSSIALGPKMEVAIQTVTTPEGKEWKWGHLLESRAKKAAKRSTPTNPPHDKLEDPAVLERANAEANAAAATPVEPEPGAAELATPVATLPPKVSTPTPPAPESPVVAAAVAKSPAVAAVLDPAKTNVMPEEKPAPVAPAANPDPVMPAIEPISKECRLVVQSGRVLLLDGNSGFEVALDGDVVASLATKEQIIQSVMVKETKDGPIIDRILTKVDPLTPLAPSNIFGAQVSLQPLTKEEAEVAHSEEKRKKDEVAKPAAGAPDPFPHYHPQQSETTMGL